jgi:hypothetical protein
MRNKTFDTLEYNSLEISPYLLNATTIACPFSEFIPEGRFVGLKYLFCGTPGLICLSEVQTFKVIPLQDISHQIERRPTALWRGLFGGIIH